MTDEELYHELAYYTLSHPDPSFIHQHVVDAYAAQHASDQTKAIQLVFALVGLYLYLDKGFTGRQVQKAHMQLAKRRKHWESYRFPQTRARSLSVMFWPHPPEANGICSSASGASRYGKPGARNKSRSPSW
jgi:Family of unknown function (DUF5946)